MKSTSKCKACGEKLLDTGNYSFKIIKAKRKPRKAEKLKRSKGAKLDEISTNFSQTKFGRFLLRRADSTNYMEITCGNCSASSRISMKKPSEKLNSNLDNQPRLSFQTPSAPLDSSLGGLSKNQRKKKKKKDFTAGLVIPPSLQSSVSSSPKVLRDNCKSEMQASKQSTQTVQTPNSNSKFQQMNSNKKNNQAKKPALSEEKQMEHLKKMFTKSNKQSSQRKGGSLKDLLSSM